MREAHKALKVLAIAWIACSVTASSVTGMVLCIGADGHFSLEFAHHDHCGQEQHGHADTPHESVQVRESDANDCCGGCIDMPLSPDIMSQLTEAMRHKRMTEDTALRTLSTSSPIDDGLKFPGSRCDLRRRSHLPDSYALLLLKRTTVLLV